MFEDLIPEGNRPAAPGMFDDLTPKPATPGFIPTVKRTGGQMLTTLATSVEDITGPNAATKAVKDAGQGIIDRNPAGIGGIGDIVESPWLAVKEATGQFVPQIAAAAGGAAAGGAAGRRIAGAPGAAIGAGIGALTPIFTQEYGGIRQDQQESGQESIPRALGAATAATALERVGLGKALKFIKSPGSVPISSIPAEIGKGVLKEGATEAAQTSIEQVGAFKDPTTQESLQEAGFSGVMGGIGGGVVGGVMGAAGKMRPTPAAPAVAPAAPVPTVPAVPTPGDAIRAAAPEVIGPLTGGLSALAESQARAVDAAIPVGQAQELPGGIADLVMQSRTPEQIARDGKRQIELDRFKNQNLQGADTLSQGALDSGFDTRELSLEEAAALVAPQDTKAQPIPTGTATELPLETVEPTAAPDPQREPRTPKPQSTRGMTDADVVKAYVEQRRTEGTLAGRRFAGDFDAGRIKPEDVLALVRGRKEPTPDERLAATAAQAPKPRTDGLVDAEGKAIAPTKEQPNADQHGAPKSALVVAGASNRRAPTADTSGGPVGPLPTGTGGIQPATGKPVAGSADSGPDRVGAKPDGALSLLQLRQAWNEAASRGDDEEATRINDLIVSKKAGKSDTSSKPVQEPAKSEQDAPTVSNVVDLQGEKQIRELSKAIAKAERDEVLFNLSEIRLYRQTGSLSDANAQKAIDALRGVVEGGDFDDAMEIVDPILEAAGKKHAQRLDEPANDAKAAPTKSPASGVAAQQPKEAPDGNQARTQANAQAAPEGSAQSPDAQGLLTPAPRTLKERRAAEKEQSDGSVARAIRKAVEDVPSRIVGSWHPVTVSANGRTQVFMSNIKRVVSDGKGPQAISLQQIRPGRLMAGDPLRPLVYSYKLNRANELVEEGIPREPSESEASRWKNAFEKNAPINPPQTPPREAPTQRAGAAEAAAPAAVPGAASAGVEADGLTEGEFIRPANNAERMMGPARRNGIARNMGGVYLAKGSRGAGFYKEATAPKPSALDSEPSGGVLPPGFRGMTWRQAVDKIVAEHGRAAYIDGKSLMYPSGRQGQSNGIGNVPADVIQYATEALKPKSAESSGDWWDELDSKPSTLKDGISDLGRVIRPDYYSEGYPWQTGYEAQLSGSSVAQNGADIVAMADVYSGAGMRLRDAIRHAEIVGDTVPQEAYDKLESLKKNAVAPDEKAPPQGRAPEAAAPGPAPSAPNERDAFEHAGLKVYPGRVRVGDKIEDRWAVQLPENKANGKVLGDTLHTTREEAMKAAEREVARFEREQRNRAEQDAADATRRAEEDARKASNAGKSLVERRAEAILDHETSENGERMTRRQWVDRKVSEGLAPRTTQEDRIKPLTRSQFNRATGEEQRAHERKIKAGGKKDVYWIGDYEVTKTEHDYAQKRKTQDAPINPPQTPPREAPTQRAGEAEAAETTAVPGAADAGVEAARVGKDRQSLEEKRQMVADMIATKKANREAVPDAWVKRLADLSAELRGEVTDSVSVYSLEVPGHPLFDGPPVLRNLVPIKVNTAADAQRALDRALELERSAATEFYGARQALKVARTAAEKKAAQDRVTKLNNQGWDEDALKMLRDETIAELSRLVDAAPTTNAVAPDEKAPPTSRVPEAAAPAEEDPFAALFGTPAEQAESQRRFLASQEAEQQAKQAEQAHVERVRSAIMAEKKRATAEHDDWAGKVYKANRTQVELRGDGPSNQASMSIGAINESRRRNAMEALAQELRALDKLDAALKQDSAKVMTTLRDMLQKADRAVASGNWPNITADSMFESMLLDELKFRGPGGKGNVTSNGLSKALLAAIKKQGINEQAQKAQSQDQQKDGNQVAGTDRAGGGDVAQKVEPAPTTIRERREKKAAPTTEQAPAPEPERNEKLVALRKQLSVLKSIRKCLG